MNQSQTPPPDDDLSAWVIPLHGISVPPSDDTAESLALNSASDETDPEIEALPFPIEELPSDEGYHPRLRRSA